MANKLKILTGQFAKGVNMNKKLLISTMLTLLLSLIVIAGVLAGTTRDQGTLETEPPAGNVNWTAWRSVVDGSGEIVHPPSEIMTEDSFNAAQESGGGYTDAGWQIQVENFSTAGDRVNLVFCGLANRAGENWTYTFNWNWDRSESTTVHPEVPLRAGTGFTAPPMQIEFDAAKDAYLISFSGEASTQYDLYRSQNRADENVERSNGRYAWIASVTTNDQGFGEHEDDSFDPDHPAWYVVMYFAETWNGDHGCHSEEGELLKQCVLEPSGEYRPDTHDVLLSWKSYSEADIESFNVHRSISKTGTRVKLNDEPINAEPAGGPFSFIDRDPGEGRTNYYWIEIVGEVSCQAQVGPVMVEIPAIKVPFGYYFPLIFR